MRMRTFLIVLCCIVAVTYILLMLTATGQQNDSFKNIMSQTHQQIKEFHENLVSNKKKLLDIEPKYLELLGFNQPVQPDTAGIAFSIVSYVLNGQAPSAILLIQNIAQKLSNETLLLYDLGLSEDDSRSLTTYCNNSKCTVIPYDLTRFPSHVADEHMHAFRPLIIKDALRRCHSILFLENNMRVRGTPNEIRDAQHQANQTGVLGWTMRQAVSSRTHPKMFDYFQTNQDNFIFSRMVSLDAVFFIQSSTMNNKILLPWIKCTLTLECIHPIGAQSIGCRYNKKPLYRYSGCHNYDVSAFNIVLGLTWNLDETKYSHGGDGDSNLFYSETLEQATKILENRRKNISDTSEHPFTDD